MKKGLSGLLGLALLAGVAITGCNNGTGVVQPVGVNPGVVGQGGEVTLGHAFISTSTIGLEDTSELGTIDVAAQDSFVSFGNVSVLNGVVVSTALFSNGAGNLTNPVGVSLDAVRNQIYIANDDLTGPDTIQVVNSPNLLAGAVNATPNAVFIPGDLGGAQIIGVRHAFVDSTRGLVYVADAGTDSIFVYNLGAVVAGGTAAAISQITIGAGTGVAFIDPEEIFLDEARNVIYIASQGNALGTDGAVTSFDIDQLNAGAGLVAGLNAIAVDDVGLVRQIRDDGGGINNRGAANAPADAVTGVGVDVLRNQLSFYVRNQLGGIGRIIRVDNADQAWTLDAGVNAFVAGQVVFDTNQDGVPDLASDVDLFGVQAQGGALNTTNNSVFVDPIANRLYYTQDGDSSFSRVNNYSFNNDTTLITIAGQTFGALGNTAITNASLNGDPDGGGVAANATVITGIVIDINRN